MIMRTDPFRELDRLAERLLGNGGFAAMPMDAYRDGEQFVVHFDLPGVAPDSIELTVENHVLTVSAERHWEPAEGQRVVAAERPQGKWRRQLYLGDNLDLDKVSANLDNGVLTVTIPVSEKAQTRRIEVSAPGAKVLEAANA